MNRLSGMFIAVLVGSVLTVAPALGQNSGSNAEPPTSSAANKTSAGTPMSDSDFVNRAAQGGMAEVELGQLAEQKATNP